MTDAEIIRALGGPTEVAKRLGFAAGGVQRVHNWLQRGIPARIKLDHPALFQPPRLQDAAPSDEVRCAG
jgi:hypothetical protein